MTNDNDPIDSSQNDEDHHEVVDNIDALDEESAAKEMLTGDDPKIHFTSINVADGKNGEAKVDIRTMPNTIGMDKDELMKYANDPFWVRLRMLLFILFWIGWITMLVGAVIIILIAPRCPPPPHLEWYQKTAMYQVDVASFKDSDGDGVGDLQGLLSKLTYFTEIHVKTLLLGTIYPIASDTTYGLLNHTEIDSRLGTMADMIAFLAEAKKQDIKVILDFIPNQSSDTHPWFKASAARDGFYEDFYVWMDGEAGLPNNWCTFNDSSWHLDNDRQQYYYSTYDASAPDLNLRSEHVQEKLKDILRFWLDKGVDGFKVLSASYLVEDLHLRNEPVKKKLLSSAGGCGSLDQIYRVDQPENLEVIARWKGLLNNYSATTGTDKILMADLVGDADAMLPYHGNSSHVLVEFPINLELTLLNEGSSPYDLKKILDFWIKTYENLGWPNWMLGNSYMLRLADRVGMELIDGIHMVSMLTRGTPITYFGDELAMTMSPTDGGHMPWTYTNISASSEHTNVKTQMLAERSHLKVFSYVSELRNQPAVKFGIQEYPLITDSIFSMVRVKKGSPAYLIVLNMSSNTTTVDLSKSSSVFPDAARLEIRSTNMVDGFMLEGEHPKIWLNKVIMRPKQSMVLSFVPQFED